MCFLVALFEGLDIQSMGVAAPRVAAAFHLDPGQMGVVMSSSTLGLMIGAELITDRESRRPAAALCQRVLTRAFHNGLILLSCGVSTLRFIPPLLVSRENVNEAMGLLEISLKEAMVEN